MTNNKQQTAVEWFSGRQYDLESLRDVGAISIVLYYEQLTQALQQAKERYNDEIEAAIIKQCATESTSKASSYSEGYKDGYNRALELSKWAISNLVPPHNEKK